MSRCQSEGKGFADAVFAIWLGLQPPFDSGGRSGGSDGLNPFEEVTMKRLAVMLVFVVAAVQSPVAPATAQQMYGTPGSPSSTMSITGDQLPPPPQKFGGKITTNAAQSKPYWPARVVPPK